MPSSHLILWCPLFLLLSIFPSIRDFSNEWSVRIRWPKYWSFSFSISPSSEYSGLISLKIDRFGLLVVQGTFRSLLQHHSSRVSILCHCFLYGPAPTTIWDHWEDHILDHMDLCRQSNVSAFQHTVWACQCFPAKKQLPSAIMAAAALHSDLPKKRKSVTASTFSPSVHQAVMGLDAINLVFGFFKIFINYQFHHFLHDNFLSLFLFSCLFWRLCLFVMNSHLFNCYFISSYVWAFFVEGLSIPYCYPKHSMLSGSQKENKQTPNKKLPEE